MYKVPPVTTGLSTAWTLTQRSHSTTLTRTFFFIIRTPFSLVSHSCLERTVSSVGGVDLSRNQQEFRELEQGQLLTLWDSRTVAGQRSWWEKVRPGIGGGRGLCASLSLWHLLSQLLEKEDQPQKEGFCPPGNVTGVLQIPQQKEEKWLYAKQISKDICYALTP